MSDFDSDLVRLSQIRRSQASARPTNENPAWMHAHADCNFALSFIDKLWEEYARTLRDADRWRALVRSHPSQETDFSSGPGTHKDMLLRIDCTGCERYTESGAPDWKATLEACMDDEIRNFASSASIKEPT